MDSAATSYENPTAGAALVLQVPGMHEAEVAGEIEYTSTPDGGLRLDVYRHREAATALPAVLLGGPPAFDAGKTRARRSAGAS